MHGIRAAALGAVLLVLAGGPVAAQPFDGSAAVKEHLEFLGYSVEEKEDHLLARHGANYTITLKLFRGGILITAFITGDDFARTDRLGFLNVINKINKGASAVRYYADDDSDLAAEGWYPGAYDRERFGTLIEEYNADMGRLVELDAAEKKYFK